VSLYAIKNYTIKTMPWMWPILSRARYFPVFYWTWKRWFPGSATHWERHYEHGGNSGPGSYGESASYKAHVINQFIRERGIRSIVEFGCGDGNQLASIEVEQYIGLDVSKNAVQRCVERHGDTPKRTFIWYDQNYFHNPQEIVGADCAMSLDVVFHLIEDDVFARYIRTLFSCGRRFVITYGLDQDDVQRGHGPLSEIFRLHRRERPGLSHRRPRTPDGQVRGFLSVRANSQHQAAQRRLIRRAQHRTSANARTAHWRIIGETIRPATADRARRRRSSHPADEENPLQSRWAPRGPSSTASFPARAE
jgi:SAM-dependent methyltransferase